MTQNTCKVQNLYQVMRYYEKDFKIGNIQKYWEKRKSKTELYKKPQNIPK